MARFHMDSLVTKTKPKDVRNALDSLPPGLDESYYETLKRIESQVPEYVALAKRILFWTCKTFEPLSPSALQHALAVEPDMTEIDDEDLDDEDLILSVCAGLVVLDKESNTLRFVRKWYDSLKFIHSVELIYSLEYLIELLKDSGC